MLCYFQVYSKVIQLYIYMYLFFFNSKFQSFKCELFFSQCLVWDCFANLYATCFVDRFLPSSLSLLLLVSRAYTDTVFILILTYGYGLLHILDDKI